MQRRLFRATGALMLAALLGGGCKVTPRSTLHAVRQSGVLRVGTTGDYRPFSYLDAAGRLRGFDIEAAVELGWALSVRVRFVRTSWAELVDGLVAGRYDIAMGGVRRTPDRAQRASFTQPYLLAGSCLLIRRDDAKRFRALADVDREGLEVAVEPGRASERFVRARVARARVIVFEQKQVIAQLVGSGAVDAAVVDAVDAVLAASLDRNLLAVDPWHPLSGQGFAYIARRGDAPFLGWLDRWIARRHDDGSWKRLRTRWIGDPSVAPAPRDAHYD